MCGIYGLISSRDVGAPPSDEFFRAVDAMVEVADPSSVAFALEQESGPQRLLESMKELSAATQRWKRRSAFLLLLSSPPSAERLRASAEHIVQWTAALEDVTRSGRVTRQVQRETLNALIVGGKDIAWQLERDVLGNLSAVRNLVPGDGSHDALARAYDLNLFLSSLDRLEVRGRDSAGISIYLHFPSAAALDALLDTKVDAATLRDELESRHDARFQHGVVIRPSAASSSLLFSFKVASEVGKMGENVSFLRSAIANDAAFQRALREPSVEIQALAHTRWASNGIVSVANCHPVDSALRCGSSTVAGSEGRFVACLNGDIDNYQQLVERYVRARDLEIDPLITTDAKIIPVVVAHHFQECGDLDEAFRRAVEEFEGSMAIGLMAADRPGELRLAQKGSGQGLFFGLADEAIAVASEMYGLVELTSRYVKAEGERKSGGEIFRLSSTDRGVRFEVRDGDRFVEVPDSREKTAEITTRDINRGQHPHFFVKEITESVTSVRNTLRGKFEVSESGGVRFLLGSDVLPVELLAGLRDGRVQKVVVLGQGTAAIAAQGVAHLLSVALAKSPHAISVVASKATEFSAHGLREDLSDTLVIAVSQSGTTTDTNRTVDIARQRGAWVLGIVNRRNSDLVYKSHGVLYTSDGRDIEMSVASTKAFYAQNVAGQVLSLAIGSTLGTISDEDLLREVRELEQLPNVMERALELGPQIEDLARRFALERRHWAVVGSGAAKVAADEIRIKLSELCYKSIAVDFTEDKKHIDLSSEPLVLVCAAGLRDEIVSDTVKEVAIFKAHQGIPIVIAEEGQDGFDAYAAGVIRVPRYDGALDYLPTTIAGHLFGYHAAHCMDRVADRLRGVRAEIVKRQEACGFGDDVAAEIVQSLGESVAQTVSELDDSLAHGELDGALGAGIATRLSASLQLLLGRLPIDGFARLRSRVRGVVPSLIESLSDAVAELARPIDAIKHQAKTVTVGISRGDAEAQRGPILTTLESLAVSTDELLESHRVFISAFDELVSSVDGVCLYQLDGLDALGRPRRETQIRCERKTGCTLSMSSRTESDHFLRGNKWAAVKHRELFLGCGEVDGRRILILPVVGETSSGRVVLLHLTLVPGGSREQRMKALKARGRVFDQLKAAITERNLEWDASLIDSIDNDTLFLMPAHRVAEEISHAKV